MKSTLQSFLNEEDKDEIKMFKIFNNFKKEMQKIFNNAHKKQTAE